ncbi:nuclear transport factor 2 family protein [Plastoroseomonas hellenica]|uniref:nuclear transport factor 2 family protein n=1 Tax=Plastoroseomonas hellenica TaxID=2687306 RepID=UPI001BA90B74|nr:nuclear transport factor 2 family protein [Plastoroseomonas hellenica]MBR0645226.1 nuclear transport factor 2 family protein [Plastoroseomonas hellenica]
MSEARRIAENYLAAWNEPDAAARAARIAWEWTPSARFTDPMMEGAGQEEITAMIGAVRAKFPGLGFALEGEPDGYGRFVRFSWSAAPEGGAAVARGTDIVRLDDAGRIAEVIGFLDAAPGA